MTIANLLQRMSDSLPFQSDHALQYALDCLECEHLLGFRRIYIAPWVKRICAEVERRKAHPWPELPDPPVSEEQLKARSLSETDIPGVAHVAQARRAPKRRNTRRGGVAL